MDHEVIDGFLHDPELPDGWNLPQGRRWRRARGGTRPPRVTRKSVRRPPRRAASAARGRSGRRGIEAAHVARAGRRMMGKAWDTRLVRAISPRPSASGSRISTYIPRGDVQPAQGIRGRPGPIAASVLDADRAARAASMVFRWKSNRGSAVVKTARRREGGASDSRSSMRREEERARIPVHLDGLVADGSLRVAGQSILPRSKADRSREFSHQSRIWRMRSWRVSSIGEATARSRGRRHRRRTSDARASARSTKPMRAHVHQHGHGHAGGAPGRALVHAGQVRAARRSSKRVRTISRVRKRKVPEIVRGLQPLGRQPVIVEDRAVVGTCA